MEQKKQPFRFRIPWTSASASSSSSRRPKKEPKSPFRPPTLHDIETKQERQKMATQSEPKMKLPLKSIIPKPQDHHHNKRPTQQYAIRKLGNKENPSSSSSTEAILKTPNTNKVVGKAQDPLTKTESTMMKVVSTKDPMSPQNSKAPLQNEMRQGISSYVHNLSNGVSKDENPFGVITLAGDNRGAIMSVGSNTKKDRPLHIHRAYKKNPEQSSIIEEEEDESSEEEESQYSKKNDNSEMGNAYVNSNIQSMNNSMMIQGSINERDPGVRFVLPQKEIKEAVKCNDDERVKETTKTVSQNDNKVSQQPRIRRRCLRGLLAEPSDSDPDNPNKPIRHGCKYKCGNI